MERELRRNQNALIITGIGMIALTLWSILKTVLFIELDSVNFEAVLSSILGDMYERSVGLFIIFFFLTIDLILRTFVGLRAKREGHGKKSGYLYVIIDAVFIIVSVYNIIYYFKPDSFTISKIDTIVTIIFELTSLYTSAELFYASIKVKKLTKACKKGA